MTFVGDAGNADTDHHRNRQNQQKTSVELSEYDDGSVYKEDRARDHASETASDESSEPGVLLVPVVEPIDKQEQEDHHRAEACGNDGPLHRRSGYWEKGCFEREAGVDDATLGCPSRSGA